MAARRERAGGDGRGPASTPTEATVLDATALLLANRRLEELSVADLIKEAGVSRASFYFYFESKQAVAAALLRRVMDQFFDLAQTWFAYEGDAPEEALRDTLHEVELAWREHAPVVNAAAEGWRSDAKLGDLWAELITYFTEAAAARIERDRADGLAPPGPDARTLAATLVWMDERCYYLATAGGEPVLEPPGAVSAALAEVWLRAVYGGRGT